MTIMPYPSGNTRTLDGLFNVADELTHPIAKEHCLSTQTTATVVLASAVIAGGITFLVIGAKYGLLFNPRST